MKRIRSFTLILIAIFFVINVNLFASTEDDSTYVHGRAVIKVSNVFTTIDTRYDGIIETEQQWFNDLSIQFEINKLEKVFDSDIERFRYNYIIEFPEEYSVLDVCEDFNPENNVIHVYPDFIIELYSVPDDTHYNYQWPHQIINAEQAWDVTVDNTEPIIIAIIDTGVDVAHPDSPTILDVHPDIEDNLYMESGSLVGYNLFHQDRLPFDDIGHGTHVAGIAAGVTNNNTGIASLAGDDNYNVKIMPIKIFGIDELSSWSIGLNAIYLAAWRGADIINMSWGGLCEGGPYNWDAVIADIESTLEYATQECNCLCIASASNSPDGWDITNYQVYPARSEYVIAVSATDITDNKAYYSNYADWVDISAPGGEMYFLQDENGFLSTLPQHYEYEFYEEGYGNWIEHNYDFLQGTSMSAPYVTSLAAMIKARFPLATNQEIRGRILGTVNDIYHDNYFGKLGSGIS